MKRKQTPKKCLDFFYYLPRFSAVLFILFISLFALDSFALPNWPVALFMHLIPAMLLGVITFIAWKYPKVGGILFTLTGMVAVYFFHSIFVAVPIWIIGSLFLLEKKN